MDHVHFQLAEPQLPVLKMLLSIVTIILVKKTLKTVLLFLVVMRKLLFYAPMEPVPVKELTVKDLRLVLFIFQYDVLITSVEVMYLSAQFIKAVPPVELCVIMVLVPTLLKIAPKILALYTYLSHVLMDSVSLKKNTVTLLMAVLSTQYINVQMENVSQIRLNALNKTVLSINQFSVLMVLVM